VRSDDSSALPVQLFETTTVYVYFVSGGTRRAALNDNEKLVFCHRATLAVLSCASRTTAGSCTASWTTGRRSASVAERRCSSSCPRRSTGSAVTSATSVPALTSHALMGSREGPIKRLRVDVCLCDMVLLRNLILLFRNVLSTVRVEVTAFLRSVC